MFTKSKLLRVLAVALLLEILAIGLIILVRSPEPASDYAAMPTLMALPQDDTTSQAKVVDTTPSDIGTKALVGTAGLDFSTVELTIDTSAVEAAIAQSQQAGTTMLPTNDVALTPDREMLEKPVPDHVVLRFVPGTSQADRDAYIKSVGGLVIEAMPALDTVVIQVAAGQTELPESALLLAAEPDYYITILDILTFSDPYYATQWSLPMIGADHAWTMIPTGTSVIVAVVDSGIYSAHPDLSGRILSGWDFVDDDSLPEDVYGHGTGVAGIIAANPDNLTGIVGVAPNVQIMPLRVLDAQGVGTYSGLASALIYAADHGAQVINLSLGGLQQSNLLQSAVNYAVSRGVIIVAAAGNTGDDTLLYPAAYGPVVAVGSVDSNGQISSFSSHNAGIDLYAPGQSILTTTNTGDYASRSGTSFAAPHVSGIAALEIAYGASLVQDGGIVSFSGTVDETPTEPTPEPTDSPVVGSVLIPDAVWAAVRDDGSAQVIINLTDSLTPQADVDTRAQSVLNAQSAVLNALSANDFEISRQYGLVPALAGSIQESGLIALQNNPMVVSIQLDAPIYAHDTEANPAVGADVLQNNFGLSGEGITVAVLDSGIDTNHPALADDIIAQACFAYHHCAPGNGNTGTNAEDDDGHGSNVAGIITAPDGIAPDAGIIAVRVMGGQDAGLTSDWIAGLDWILQNQATYHVDIVNMSFGTGDLISGVCDQAFGQVFPSGLNAINQLAAQGVILVASTGNQGSPTGINAPACLSNVIAVGATYDSVLGPQPAAGQTYGGVGFAACNDPVTGPNTVACFSNSSPVVDVLAPGAWINGPYINGGYAEYAGTSQAAPIVSGVIALMLEADPALTPAEVRSLLKDTGVPVVDPRNGLTFPKVDALAAYNELGPDACLNVSEIPQSECAVLVKLYKQTDGPNWTNNTGWLQNNTPCSWEGITCDFGHVTQIILTDNGLKGSIPKELANVQYLIALSLAQGELVGPIPPELGSLQYLAVLNLSLNKLTGEIPASLGSLSNLYALALSANQLTGPIPASLGNLDNLEILVLGLNNLTGSLPASLGNLDKLIYLLVESNNLEGPVPATLGNLHNLKYFNLGFNGVPDELQDEIFNLGNFSTGGFTGPFPAWLCTVNPDIELIDISGNQFTGNIPACMGSLSQLEYLTLDINDLTGPIPNSITQLSNLKIFTVFDNNLSGSIPANIGNMSSLEVLLLSTNELTGPVPASICSLTGLQGLLLSYNDLSGQIPDCITSLTNLVNDGDEEYYSFTIGDLIPNIFPVPLSVDFGYNQLTASPAAAAFLASKDADWASTQTIPPVTPVVVKTGTNFVQIGWDAIEYSGDDGGYYEVSYATSSGGPYTVAGTTSDKSTTHYTVRNLTPGGNYFFAVRTFTPADDFLQKNDVLSAYSPEASTTTLISICGGLTNPQKRDCEVLEIFYDSMNGDDWSFFSSGWLADDNYCSWSNIVCDINDRVIAINFLLPEAMNGPLPPEIGELSELEFFSCFDCGISGELPDTMSNLSNLDTLQIINAGFFADVADENKLSGPIPAWLGELGNLTQLNLSGNMLTGELPTELENLHNLTLLSITDNLISGPIPSAYGTLINLVQFGASANQLTGPIPDSFGNLVNLTELYLGENALEGEIPSSLVNLTSLNSLVLDLNMLYSNDPALVAFLNSIPNPEPSDPPWQETQTTIPKNIQVQPVIQASGMIGAQATSTVNLVVTWAPILYSGDSGYYEIYYATPQDEFYTLAGTTTSKADNSFTITGLDATKTYYVAVSTVTEAHADMKVAHRTSLSSPTLGLFVDDSIDIPSDPYQMENSINPTPTEDITVSCATNTAGQFRASFRSGQFRSSFRNGQAEVKFTVTTDNFAPVIAVFEVTNLGQPGESINGEIDCADSSLIQPGATTSLIITADVNTDYVIFVLGNNGTFGDFVFSSEILTDAIVTITDLPFSVGVDTGDDPDTITPSCATNATGQFRSSFRSGQFRSSFRSGQATGEVTVTTTDIAPVIGVYEEVGNSLVEVDCQAETSVGSTLMTTIFEEDKNYIIIVQGNNGTTGAFTFGLNIISPPIEDIAALPYTSSNVATGQDILIPTCATNPSGQFRSSFRSGQFRSSFRNGQADLQVDVSSAEIAPVIAIYLDNNGVLQEVGCDASNTVGDNSLAQTLILDQNYIIVIQGNNGTTGAFDFSVSLVGDTPIEITTLPFVTPGYASDMNDTVSPSCGTNATGQFRSSFRSGQFRSSFRNGSTAAGQIGISTNQIKPVIGIYEDNGGVLTEVACQSSDSASSTSMSYIFTVDVDYVIIVQGNQNSTGDFFFAFDIVGENIPEITTLPFSTDGTAVPGQDSLIPSCATNPAGQFRSSFRSGQFRSSFRNGQAEGQINVTTTNIAPVIAVYEDTGSALIEVGCQSSSSVGSASMNQSFNEDVHYIIIVQGNNGTTGSFTFNFDLISEGIPEVDQLPFVLPGTVGNTQDSILPGCATNATGQFRSSFRSGQFRSSFRNGVSEDAIIVVDSLVIKPVIGIYQVTGSLLTPVGCVANGDIGQTTLQVTLLVDTDYLILVQGNDGTTGDFTLTFDLASDDDNGGGNNGEEITTLPFETSQTSDAAASSLIPTCATNPSGQFRSSFRSGQFRSSFRNGVADLQVDVSSNEIQPVVALYEDTGSGLSEVDCESASAPGNVTLLQTVLEGKDYVIVVLGNNGTSGAFDMLVNLLSPPDACLNNPAANLNVAVAQDRHSVSIQNTSGQCAYQVGMASYQMVDWNVSTQVFYDGAVALILPGQTVQLAIDVPTCATQVDVFYGPLLLSLQEQRYNKRLLFGEHLNIGRWCNLGPGQCSIGTLVLDGITDGETLPDIVTLQATLSGGAKDARASQIVFDLTGPTSESWTELLKPYYWLGAENGWNTTTYPAGQYSLSVTSYQFEWLCETQTLNFTIGGLNTEPPANDEQQLTDQSQSVDEAETSVTPQTTAAPEVTDEVVVPTATPQAAEPTPAPVDEVVTPEAPVETPEPTDETAPETTPETSSGG